MTHGIRLELTLPVLRLGLGPFVMDPLESLVGAKLSDLLAPLMTGPQTERCNAAGVRVDVYPLALSEGEGASLPLGSWGELGLFNDRGLLVLSVPVLAAPWIAARLGEAVVRGPERIRSTDGRDHRANLWLRLRPGSRAALALGGVGEVSIEAPKQAEVRSR